MSFSRIRLLSSALLLSIGGFVGAPTLNVPSAHDPAKLSPKPGPKPKKNGTPTSPRNSSSSGSWWRRWRASQRVWAPFGGGDQECARRRAQIHKGMLGGCNDVQWTPETLEHHAQRKAELEARGGNWNNARAKLGLTAYIATDDGFKPVAPGDAVIFGVDQGSPDGDATVTAHRTADGAIHIDDVEFHTANSLQSAGRAPDQ